MPKIPHMKFYVADYLADTVHLTTEEHGAYCLLIFHYWQTEKPLNNKDGRLASVVHLSPERWAEVSKVVGEFFTIKRDKWTHGRVEYELEAVMRRSTQASYAASEGVRKRNIQRLQSDRSATDERYIVGDKDTDTDKDSNRGKSDFAQFAAIYPNLGNEKSALREFTKAALRAPVREIILGALQYAGDPNRDPTRTYLAANWLKDDRWKDPLLPKRAKRGEITEPTPTPPKIEHEPERIRTPEEMQRIADTQAQIRKTLEEKRLSNLHKGEGKK